MHPDRIKGPGIQNTFSLQFPDPEIRTGRNGIQSYIFPSESAETVRIEAVFDGSAFTSPKLYASYVFDLLTRGTKNRDAYTLNNLFDYYGTFISVDVQKDYASVVLFTLNKFLPEVLPLFREILLESTLPQDELGLLVTSNINKLKINKHKTDYMANRAFQALLFGEEHPYGRMAEAADHQAVRQEELLHFYRETLLKRGVSFFISGNVGEKEYKLLDDLFSDTGLGPLQLPDKSAYQAPAPEKGKCSFEHVEGSVQHSIRIGKVAPLSGPLEMARTSVANILLGGYFGSRLMSNLREKHGFTYGVQSGWQTFRFTHIWRVQTEVGKDVAKKATEEIFNEIRLLQQEMPSAEELQRVKSYLGGNLVRRFENVHSLATIQKPLILKGEAPDFYRNFSAEIYNVTAEQVRDVARSYWDAESLSAVSAGAE